MDKSILAERIPASIEQIKIQERLVIVLALIAGFMNAMGLIKFTLPFLGAWRLIVPALLLLICSLLISILNFNP